MTARVHLGNLGYSLDLNLEPEVADLEEKTEGGAHESGEDGADDLRAGTGLDACDSGQSTHYRWPKTKTQVGLNPTLDKPQPDMGVACE